jgi:hypothetical protein
MTLGSYNVLRCSQSTLAVISTGVSKRMCAMIVLRSVLRCASDSGAINWSGVGVAVPIAAGVGDSAGWLICGSGRGTAHPALVRVSISKAIRTRRREWNIFFSLRYAQASNQLVIVAGRSVHSAVRSIILRTLDACLSLSKRDHRVSSRRCAIPRQSSQTSRSVLLRRLKQPE